jgi:hypothetical protein
VIQVQCISFGGPFNWTVAWFNYCYRLELGRLLSVGCLECSPDMSQPFILRDDGEAMVWLHRAWDLTQNPDVAFSIGRIYLESTWIDTNHVFANEPPWSLIDVDMARGKPVYKNVDLAVEWLSRASANNHFGAGK